MFTPEELKDNITKLYKRNRLTFNSKGFRAHFLGRSSIIQDPLVPTPDVQRDVRSMASGVNMDGGWPAHANETTPPVMGAHSAFTKFTTQQLGKAFTNLQNDGYEPEDIATMVDATGKSLYNHSKYSEPKNTIIKHTADLFNDVANGNADMPEELEDVNEHSHDLQLRDMDSSTTVEMLDRGDVASIMSLGIKKEDYFADLYTAYDDSYQFAKNTDLEQTPTSFMQDLTQTFQKYTNVAGTFMKRGDSERISNMMQLGC